MRTSILTSIIAVSLSVTVPTWADDKTPVTNTSAGEPATAADVNADTRFMENATQSNWTEIKLGELAIKRAQRADVKSFAELVVQHHKNAQQSLKEIMNKVNTDLPKDITVEQQASIDDLKRTDDTNFDRMFVKRMVVNHEKGVALYEAFIGSTKSPELKNYANITIDHIKFHLQKAQELQKAIGEVAVK